MSPCDHRSSIKTPKNLTVLFQHQWNREHHLGVRSLVGLEGALLSSPHHCRPFHCWSWTIVISWHFSCELQTLPSHCLGTSSCSMSIQIKSKFRNEVKKLYGYGNIEHWEHWPVPIGNTACSHWEHCLFPLGTLPVPIGNTACSHWEHCLFPLGTLPVPIGNTCLFPLGTLPVPIGNTACSHQESTLLSLGMRVTFHLGTLCAPKRKVPFGNTVCSHQESCNLEHTVFPKVASPMEQEYYTSSVPTKRKVNFLVSTCIASYLWYERLPDLWGHS